MQRLFHQKLSPFCRKVRLALAEKRIEVALVEEKFWERRIDFLRLNPAGQVPVLEIDGLVLSDSTAICEYLEETRPEPALLPQGAAARAEARRLAAYFDDKFHGEVTVNLLHERVTKRLMKSGYPDSSNIKLGLSAIRYHLDYIDWLSDHRRWLAGDTMTIADLSAAAQLSCLDYVGDVDWNRVPNAKNWYARIKSRPSFRSLLADSLPGFQVPAHYADLDF
ncbi:glutathione S-transferase family protein [Oceanicella sp. SM1341]|uniref:FtsZ-binding protein FzlA n=1 Tax=Oceanicella sp. SM1341 TaxID=1548889 RepID=UPI000E48356B|nr:glutathione S-transferase family protein [Oceanicella sp. SM1341]